MKAACISMFLTICVCLFACRKNYPHSVTPKVLLLEWTRYGKVFCCCEMT